MNTPEPQAQAMTSAPRPDDGPPSAPLPAEEAPGGSLSLPLLCVGLVLMLGLSLYPPLVTRADGKPDHLLLMLLGWAMAAGLVRGIGFIPRLAVWRWLLSGWACLGALVAAAAWWWLHGGASAFPFAH